MLDWRPSSLLRLIYPRGVFRMDPSDHSVYLTFDDGPVPEVTPWVLELLDRYGVKATFFLVGDNVRKYPGLLEELVGRGHGVGNHSFNHVHGNSIGDAEYIDNIRKCDTYFRTSLFRPPHAIMRRSVYHSILPDYKIVFFDVLTRDYSSNLSGQDVLDNVIRYTRDGSIIVFHDSIRSKKNLEYALPKAIEWLSAEGYQFKVL